MAKTVVNIVLMWEVGFGWDSTTIIIHEKHVGILESGNQSPLN